MCDDPNTPSLGKACQIPVDYEMYFVVVLVVLDGPRRINETPRYLGLNQVQVITECIVDCRMIFRISE